MSRRGSGQLNLTRAALPERNVIDDQNNDKLDENTHRVKTTSVKESLMRAPTTSSQEDDVGCRLRLFQRQPRGSVDRANV